MDNPGYYAIIPASVRYDTRLCANAKLLYGEISALCNESGYCYASNNYFADKYKVDKVSISRWIKQLIELGYVFSKIEYSEKSKNIESRILHLREAYIPINKIVNTPLQNCYDPINKIVKENNKEEYIKEIYKEKFKKPTLGEVRNYCLERNNNINCQEFIDYYESVGWMIGKKHMRDWKAAVRTWERNNKKKNNESPSEGVVYESIRL